MKTYAVLRGLKHGNRFWVIVQPNEIQESIVQLHDGTVGYEVLAEFDTGDECQIFLFGFVQPNWRTN